MECLIPLDVFVDATTFTVTVTTVGNDYYDDTEGVTVRGKIRAEWTATKMTELGSTPDMDGTGYDGGSDQGDNGEDLNLEDVEELLRQLGQDLPDLPF